MSGSDESSAMLDSESKRSQSRAMTFDILFKHVCSKPFCRSSSFSIRAPIDCISAVHLPFLCMPMMKKPRLATAVLFLAGNHNTVGFLLGYVHHTHEKLSPNKLNLPQRRLSRIQSPSTTACFAEQEKTGGTARFTGLDEGATNGFDYVLSLIVSDVGSTVLGLIGLIICVAHRLANTDSLSADTMGQETRADLLAVFASGAVLLNGISKLDVTSALAESVVLDGETLPEPIFYENVNREKDVAWALESILAATPAKTAVLLNTDDDSWTISAVAGVVPRDPLLRRAPSVDATPILNRFRKDSTKESYLPTLQTLPGRVEFTYLPLNTQGVLFLPVNDETVLVLGTDTAKSFTPRDVAWCLSIATRIGTFLQSS